MRVSSTGYVAALPTALLTWWFLESPKLIFKILFFIFAFTAHQVGYKSLFKTFFKPWKNEYGEGLVCFSIFMGMFMKSLLIFADTAILLILVFLEIIFFGVWVILPVIIIWLLYASIFT